MGGEPPRPPFWSVYLVRCRDGSLYCGVTTDLAKRIATHNAGKGAKYTARRRPVRLVWSEPAVDRSAALRREYAVKALSRRAKLALAASFSRGADLPRA
ncbi:MAG TPA: GIY-YIG nuclease family protein [Candidatus Thermoplasmatota archaeon]|nr:GIY-YIG nuclease family protein [Candidatus Thermoplasmatota archaeon]